MNEIVCIHDMTATALALGLTTAVGMGTVEWPKHEPIYVTTESNPTFSPFGVFFVSAPTESLEGFSQDMTEIFASLSEGQEPLGPEFEAVWDENLDALYQS